MERMELEGSLNELKTGERSVPDQVAQFFEMAGKLHAAYQIGSPEEKREILKTVTSNRMVDQKKLELVMLPPFEAVARREKISNCAPSRSWNSASQAPQAFLGALPILLLKHLGHWAMQTA